WPASDGRCRRLPRHQNKAPAGIWPYVCRIAALRPRTDVRLPMRRHDGCADPTSIDSFLPAPLLRDLFVPEAVVRLGPGGRDFSADHRCKTAAYHVSAHVDVNDESTNGCESSRDVYRNRQIAQPSRTP